MHQSNKFKPTKRCGCRTCRRYSKYKQFALRNSNRQFRRSGKQQLMKLDNLEDFSTILKSAGYTD